jgi:hypothetical protein
VKKSQPLYSTHSQLYQYNKCCFSNFSATDSGL